MVNKKAEDISMTMARYMVAGLPMPDHLYDDLMKEVCEDFKKEREGRKPSDGSATMA